MLTPVAQPQKIGVTAAALAALGVLAASHFLVDTTATFVNPLWHSLEQMLTLERGGLLWVYVAWSASTSFSQLAFGLWADRFHGRWLIWGGPAVAIVCMSCIGLVGSSGALCGLLVLGGLGIAAFHPEAAATAGSLAPEHRSRVMAVFALSGYLGQAVGPYYSGTVTARYGNPALAWSLCWASVALVVCAIGVHRIPRHDVGQNKRATSLKEIFSGRVKTLLLLLSLGALRITPALGIPLSFAYLLGQQNQTNEEIGLIQSAFMAGIGSGGMICALLVHQRIERLVLWVMPLCAVPAIISLHFLSGWLLLLCVGLSGFLLGVAMPVYISIGQQLFPKGQRAASSITMGVSWGISGAVVAGTVRILNHLDNLEYIFFGFAGACVASSLLCIWLPRVYSQRAAGM